MDSKAAAYAQFLNTHDSASFNRVVAQFTSLLYYYANTIIASPEEAEEIVSDVFIKLWQQRGRLPDVPYINFYLLKAVKNTALNYLKRNSRRAANHAVWEVAVNTREARNPENLLISKEHLARIRSAIAALPPRCRQVFILVKEEGLSYEEAAWLLDISKATVNVQMTIAMKKIWEALHPILQLSNS